MREKHYSFSLKQRKSFVKKNTTTSKADACFVTLQLALNVFNSEINAK